VKRTKSEAKRELPRQVDQLFAAWQRVQGQRLMRLRLKDLYQFHGLLLHEEVMAQMPPTVAVGMGVEIGLEFAAVYGVPKRRQQEEAVVEYKQEVKELTGDDRVEVGEVGFLAGRADG